ncbi:hypothetical protein LENED_004707 [Lentinula edodes]|uniref:Uncharacterized protein n=1 Tax=Lentinula edodes TaxID=5353 RepID=A0A1Q3E7K1_LENED|nr:hypothetical protein LENED_004707 [Lentinula edodes]
MAIGLAKLDLITVFVECVLYGFFLLLSIISFSIVMKRRRIKHLQSRGTLKILFVVLVMLLLATLHVSVHFHRTLSAFFKSGSSGAATEKINTIGKLDGILVSIDSVGYTLKTTTYYLQTYVGDAFVIYRVHIVWSGNKKVMTPIVVSFLTSVGLSIYVLQEMAQAARGDTIFESRLYDSILCFFVLTLFTNLGSTKSAAIYSAMLVVILILYTLKIHTVYLLLDAVTQLIGIVFTFVVIRVAIGVSTEATPPLRPDDEPESPVSLSGLEDKEIVMSMT